MRTIFSSSFVFVLLVAIVYGQSDETHEIDPVKAISKIFHITLEEAQRCVDKTGVTGDDLYAFEHAMPNFEVANAGCVRRTTCTIACAAQTQGYMIGSKFQIDKLHTLVAVTDAPPDVQESVHNALDVCNEAVKHLDDDCDVARLFLTCLINKHQYFAH